MLRRLGCTRYHVFHVQGLTWMKEVLFLLGGLSHKRKNQRNNHQTNSQGHEELNEKPEVPYQEDEKYDCDYGRDQFVIFQKVQSQIKQFHSSLPLLYRRRVKEKLKGPLISIAGEVLKSRDSY